MLKIFLALLIASVVLAGCIQRGDLGIVPTAQPTAQSTATPQASPSSASGDAFVSITAGGFVPSELAVERGASVLFVNEDTEPHAVAFVDSSSGVLYGLDTYQFTFDQPGEYAFADEYGDFSGMIVVR